MLQKKQLLNLRERVLPWIIPIGFLIIWQCLYSFQLIPESYLRNISSPVNVVRSGIELASSGELLKHLLISGKRAILGLLIGGGIGLMFGIITGISSLCKQLFNSSLQMLQTIPHLALIPLVILWFGVDETSKIFLVALGTFFPIYLNTFHGIRNTDPDLIEMANNYELSQWQIFKDVILPSAMPNILVGLRFALGLMWLILIVAETIAANEGIGYLAMNAREFFQVDIILLTILIYAFLGVSADYITKRLEHHFLSWNEVYQ
ncbi:ABC transporter permease subunit [Neisseriaceae bacterium PsAf]|nr:ABC transporter permease subunit [Neisseriaceae bacterium PsAf]